MKNLFLSVVLLLTVSFVFAANDVEKVSTVDIVTVELTNPTIENATNFDQTLDIECLFELSWDTDELGTGSLWIDCGPTDDGPFSWSDFLDTILANFLGIE
jgi:hypothetical protein